MPYNKNIWKRKDRITKEKLNHMEDGIYDAHDKIEGAINDFSSQIKEDVNKIKNLDDFFKNDVILYPTYGGFLNGSSNLELYISNDANTCYSVNSKPIFTSNTGKPQWDYSIMYYNDKFYMITDYKKFDDTWGGNAFNIISTEDFKTFNEFTFSFRDIDTSINQTWAPEFLIYNNEVYIFFSMQKNNETYVGTDLNKPSQAFNRTYYSKALNSDLTSWSNPKLLKMPTDVCRIDPCVVYADGTFHLYLCEDDHARIEHFTANSLDDTWTYVGVLPFPARTEAPAVIKFNNKYYMYVDSHRGCGNNDQGLYHMAESTDLTNWTNIKIFKNQSRLKMRHFTPLVLSSDIEKDVIKNLFNEVSNNQGEGILKTFDYIDKTKDKKNMSFVDLGSYTGDGTIDELKVLNNTVYYINAVDIPVIINKININYLNDFDKFYFMVNTVDNKTKIVIRNICIGGAMCLHEDYFTIGGMAKNSRNIVGFTVKDKRVQFINSPEYSHKDYVIPYNFVANECFTDGLNNWSARQGLEPTVSDEHIGVGEKSCRIYSDGTKQFQGISQTVQLLPNTVYDLSIFYLIKDKSKFDDIMAIELKGIQGSVNSTNDVVLVKKQIDSLNMQEHYWIELKVSFDTKNLNLNDYNSFYVYFYLKNKGEVFITRFNLSKNICN